MTENKRQQWYFDDFDKEDFKFYILNQETDQYEVMNKKNRDIIPAGTQIRERVEAFGKRQHYFYDKDKKFWTWNEKLYKYEERDETDMLNTLGHTVKCYNFLLLKQVATNYIEALRRLGRFRQVKDKPAHLIQFTSKYYNLKTDMVTDVTPFYFNTNPIPRILVSDTATPNIDRLMATWVGKDYVTALKEIVAYCCLTDYPLHGWFCLFGSGGNGKGQFQELLERFLGSENICSSDLEGLAKDKFAPAALHLKLACLIDEVDHTTLRNTRTLKRITGGGTIRVEYKYGQGFEYKNYAKLIVSTNGLPSIDDTTDGFYRRFNLIRFPNKLFPEGVEATPNDLVGCIPELEYNALANQCITLIKGLLEKGKFVSEKSVEGKKADYELHSNPITAFLECFVQTSTNKFIPYADMYNNYFKFVKKLNLRTVSKSAFSKGLNKEGISVSKTSRSYEYCDRPGDKFQSDLQDRFQGHIIDQIMWVGDFDEMLESFSCEDLMNSGRKRVTERVTISEKRVTEPVVGDGTISNELDLSGNSDPFSKSSDRFDSPFSDSSQP